MTYLNCCEIGDACMYHSHLNSYHSYLNCCEIGDTWTYHSHGSTFISPGTM